MQIRVELLKSRPRRLIIDEPVDNFATLAELAAQGVATFAGQVTGELEALLADDLIEVEGTLTCTVVQGCSRCLQPVEQRLAVPVAWSFVRESFVPPGEAPEEELSEEAVGLIPFTGETIELHEAIEQELLMALPQHPLCSDGCAGLCPVCGADRNREPCGCAPPVFHGGFAALRNFRPAGE